MANLFSVAHFVSRDRYCICFLFIIIGVPWEGHFMYGLCKSCVVMIYLLSLWQLMLYLSLGSLKFLFSVRKEWYNWKMYMNWRYVVLSTGALLWTNLVTQLHVGGSQPHKGNQRVTDLLSGFEVAFVRPVKAVAFSYHIIQCHTPFHVCADWISVAVPLQLLPAGVVCNSCYCVCGVCSFFRGGPIPYPNLTNFVPNYFTICSHAHTDFLINNKITCLAVW